MRHPIRATLTLLFAMTILIALPGRAAAQSNDWTDPFPPFRVVGNLYYVGSKGLANYLITTPAGHILINSDMEANVPLIRESIEKLGFRFEDVKILLISHAHFDHCGASATIKDSTGAKYMVMDADVATVESGGALDFQYGAEESSRYRTTKVDRVLHDGDTVRLGDAVLTAHHTPGHTKGCTTWTMRAREKERAYDVVIVGGCGVNPGYKLVGNTSYPAITRDYARTFGVLKSLPCDYFLGAHGLYFDMEAKYALFKEGATASPFIDPAGYRAYVRTMEKRFGAELAAQRAEQGKGTGGTKNRAARPKGGRSR